jgi:DNA-binding CsgD family transcriptional regulator
MTQLAASDLERVVSFLGTAVERDGPEPFTAELLDLLAELFQADFADFADFDLRASVVNHAVVCSADDEPEPPGAMTEEMVEINRTCTTLVHRRTSGRPYAIVAWSDLAGRRARRTCDGEEWARPWGVVDSLSIPLEPSVERKVWVSLWRQRADFGPRERRLAELLQPHLAARHRAAALRREPAGLDPGLLVNGDAPRRADAAPCLTRREREVVDAVAEGRSNAEIARQLCISPATVAKHLEHVYGKLGVHSRTAALARLSGTSPAAGLGPEDGPPRAGEEAGVEQEREHLGLRHRPPVVALNGEALRAAAPHVGDERVQGRAEPRLVRLAQRHERAPAALDEEHGLAAE